MGLVRRWLGQRHRQQRGRGLHERPGPACSDPNALPGSTWPVCPDALFQFHHQPFNYYANYEVGAPGRSHLKDEVDFTNAVAAGQLPAVSFVKPVGEENEHPGYASQPDGNDHLVDLLKAIESGPQAASTMVIVTYDEFGGQWDHVKPPTQKKVSDPFGPGTRIPAIVIAPNLSRAHVGRQHVARHDLDPGHDRAPVRAGAPLVARQGGQRRGHRLYSLIRRGPVGASGRPAVRCWPGRRRGARGPSAR